MRGIITGSVLCASLLIIGSVPFVPVADGCNIQETACASVWWENEGPATASPHGLHSGGTSQLPGEGNLQPGPVCAFGVGGECQTDGPTVLIGDGCQRATAETATPGGVDYASASKGPACGSPGGGLLAILGDAQEESSGQTTDPGGLAESVSTLLPLPSAP